MAKVKNQNIPLYVDTDPADDEAQPFPDKYRSALKQASDKKGLPLDIGVVSKTLRGRRPPTRTKKVLGYWYDPSFMPAPFDPLAVPDAELRSMSGSKTKSRVLFKQVVEMWHRLSVVSRACWYQKNKDAGMKCSTFDFFLRTQLRHWYKYGTWDTQTCQTCITPAVTYVTSTMTPGQQQTLRIYDQTWGPFSWAIFSGGGNLSAPTGNEVVFTAPLLNSRCVNNTVIVVTDRCGLKTFFRLTTNAAGTGGDAYMVTKVHCWQHQPDPSSFEGVSTFGPYCYACFSRIFDCSGTYLRTSMTAWMWTDLNNDISPLWCSQNCGGSGAVVDLRTQFLKQQGCCPSALY